MTGVREAADTARDPFADDVLERLIASNQDYQRSHGHYIVPLAERLLEARRALVAAAERAETAEATMEMGIAQMQRHLDAERKARKATEELNVERAVRERSNLEAVAESERVRAEAAEAKAATLEANARDAANSIDRFLDQPREHRDDIYLMDAANLLAAAGGAADSTEETG